MRFESCENIVWISFKENVWEVAPPPPLRVGKSVISVCKKTMNLQQLKGMQNSNLGMWKGYFFWKIVLLVNH